MKSLFPAQSYTDPAVFRDEQERLFGRTWQLAGFASDLAEPTAFITTEIGGRSVVVQNFDGELRAFLNVCSHRFARIHCEAKGAGPLRCPYHGWIYNKDGVPYSIPSRPRFDGLTPEVVQGLALERWSVEACGQLVFVRRGEGPSLQEFLGESYPIMRGMGEAIGDLVDLYEVEIAANWKAVVENSLEGYHVGFVHANTLKKLESGNGPKMDFRFYGPHSTHTAPVDPSTTTQLRKLTAKMALTYEVDGYWHQLTFPNLTITTTHGTVFGVQSFKPLAPDRTLMRSYLFAARRGPESKVPAGVVAQMNQSAAEFARAVFAEDKQICEEVGAGLARGANKAGLLSDEEERVHRFQRAYVDAMAVPSSPPA